MDGRKLTKPLPEAAMSDQPPALPAPEPARPKVYTGWARVYLTFWKRVCEVPSRGWCMDRLKASEEWYRGLEVVVVRGTEPPGPVVTPPKRRAA